MRLFTTATSDRGDDDNNDHNNNNYDTESIGTLSDGSYDPVTGQKQGIQVEIHADRYLAAGNGTSNDNNNNNNTAAAIIQTLSDPIEALDFDVTSPASIPGPDPTNRSPRTIRFVATASGPAEGVLFWWELDLYKNDDELNGDKNNTDLTYTTEPGSDFQDHWHQCLYVFPSHGADTGDDTSRSSIVMVEKGKEYTLLASHTDSRVHFSIRTDNAGCGKGNGNGDCNDPTKLLNSNNNSRRNNIIESNARESKRSRPTIPAESSPVVSPRRCWQLNDTDRLAKFRDGIRVALESLKNNNENNNHHHRATTATVLDLSDFSLCGIMASLLGARSVTSVESSSSGLPLAAAKVAQIGNNLPQSYDNNKSNKNCFQILQCHAESLTRDIFLVQDGETESSLQQLETDDEQAKAAAALAVVDLVVGEPYYEMLEGWSIETSLNYFYTIRMLKRKKIVRADALCVPARAVIVACGIQCEDIGKSYRRSLCARQSNGNNNESSSSEIDREEPLSSLASASCCVSGFDHQPVVDCWKYDQHGVSIPLWEYNQVVPVTEVVEIGTLDYENDAILSNGNWVDVPSEIENGVVANNQGIRAPFTNANAKPTSPGKSRVCHAIAFWVDYKIRNNDDDDDNTHSNHHGHHYKPSFTTVSTGFASPSQCAEKQTVRILSTPQPVVMGESLLIPRHDLEL